jgi:galactosamine-6-phosphate isomerase
MQVRILADYEAMSQAAAAEVIDSINQNPNALICFASGDTPKLTCKILTERILAEKIDISGCTFIGLDEWIGVPPDNAGSCNYFLTNSLFKPLNLAANQYHIFSADAAISATECARMDGIIAQAGGIDVIVVGIGLNGHIGFNEPGVSLQNRCHVIELDELTRSVGQKYFTEPTTLTHGITVGLQHLLEAKKAILIANGSKKAQIMQAVMASEVSESLPATIMHQHPNGFIMIDQAAAELL